MNSGVGALRVVRAAALAGVLAGCSGAPVPSGSGGVLASGPAGSSAVRTPAPLATATPRPSPTPAATPFVAPAYVPALPLGPLSGAPFDIAWQPIEAREVPYDPEYLDDGTWPQAVRWGDGAVVTYATGAEDGPQRGPVVWRSADLVEWHRVLHAGPGPDAFDVEQLLVGGPGLVALGRSQADGTKVLWVSGDGERWEAITDLPALSFVWARPGVIVGVGRETWLSGDGRRWWPAGASPLADTNPPWVPLVDDGDSAVVFLRDWADEDDDSAAVWRLTPDGRWKQLAILDGLVRRAVRGSNGIVAIGAQGSDRAPTAWLSADGVDWTSGPGPQDARTLVVTRAGYVATTQRSYFDGCAGLVLGEQVAQTWTSHDGLTWRQMPEQVLLDHTVLSLVFPEGDRLVALGLRWSGSFDGDDVPRFDPVAFEARLPAPEPSHTPLPTGGGCGEA